MRQLKICWWILVIGFALSANVMVAQDTQGVTTEQFEEYQKEIDYSKTKRALRLRKSIDLDDIEEREEEVSPSFNWGQGVGGIFTLLAYFLIGLLLLAILYFIFANIKIDKELAVVEIEPELLEEHIEDIDVKTEYDKALAAGNYRLALRMRFIEILQGLSLSKKIDWRYDKTNRDYARELKGTSIHQNFRNISNIFEWVWYGNHGIDSVEFERYNSSFDHFNEGAE